MKKIAVSSASLDALTESLRIERDLVGRYLGDLLQENRGIKYQLSGINMGLRGGGLAAGVRHRQTTTLPKVPQEEHAAAHSKGAPLPWLFCH